MASTLLSAFTNISHPTPLPGRQDKTEMSSQDLCLQVNTLEIFSHISIKAKWALGGKNQERRCYTDSASTSLFTAIPLWLQKAKQNPALPRSFVLWRQLMLTCYNWRTPPVCLPFHCTWDCGSQNIDEALRVCMLNRFSHVQLFATIWTGPPGSAVHGILQARILEWVAMTSSRGFSWPRDGTHVSCGSCIAGRFFTTEPPGKPQRPKLKHNSLVCKQSGLEWSLWYERFRQPLACCCASPREDIHVHVQDAFYHVCIPSSGKEKRGRETRGHSPSLGMVWKLQIFICAHTSLANTWSHDSIEKLQPFQPDHMKEGGNGH